MQKLLRLVLLLSFGLFSLPVFGYGGSVSDVRQMGWVHPVDYRSYEPCAIFGLSTGGYAGHVGDDLCRAPGTNVVAIAAGCVEGYRDDLTDYGGTNHEKGGAILLQHKTESGQTFYAVYGHIISNAAYLNERKCSGGTKSVGKGDIIASVNFYIGGSDHLHFGIRPDAIDPERMYRGNYCFDANGNARPDNCGWVEPFGFLNQNRPASSITKCAQISATQWVCWRTKDWFDSSCENATAWGIEDSTTRSTRIADKNICLTPCYSGQASILDFFIRPAYAGTLNACAKQVPSEEHLESPGTPPVSGSNNTGDLPDLVMRDVYLEDANQNKVTRLHIKEKGHCHMSVINNGKVKAKGTFENRCWLSVGNQFDGKDKAEDIGKEDMSDLDNGKSRVSHEDFYAPDYPGKRNLVGCTDASSKIKELNEKNNCNLGDQAVLQEYRFDVWSSPNLTTTAISLNGKTSLNINEPFIISSTTYNAGENFGQDYVYIGYFDNGALIGKNQIRRDNMQGGYSKIEELSVPGGIVTAGTHEIKACSDFSNDIAETDETDNCLTVAVEVKDPSALDPNRFYPCPVITQANWVSDGWSSKGYSAPFDSNGNLRIVPSCMKSRPDSIDIVLGQDGYSTIVYMTMYIRKKDTGADVPFPLTCSGQVNNGWCAGKATLNMSGVGVDTSSSSNPNLLFAYVCEVVNGAFQCPPYWQIQGAGLP